MDPTGRLAAVRAAPDTPPVARALLAASAALAALAFASTPAPAQQPPTGQRTQAQPVQGTARQPAAAVDRDNPHPNTIVLIDPGVEQRLPPELRAERVTAEQMYKGFRATHLMGQGAYGPNGSKIGEVQEVLVDADARVTAIVVEGGGFLDIGDAAFRVPWREVDLTPGRDGVRIPITEANAERYGLFDGPETLATGPREFRLSEVIGDAARLRNGVGYGLVTDVALSREGRIVGLVVNRDIGWGASLYAYPFYGVGYGFVPGANWIALPHLTPEEAAGAPRIDLSRFDAGVL